MIKFIYFGRLTYEKGIDHLIEAFSAIYNQGTTNRFLDIYGDGPLLQVCKNRAKTLPHNIHIHGRTNQQTIHTALRTMHYCLMPSRVMESFGMSALESLSYGVTVIGPKKGGLEQFISDEHDTDKKPLVDILHHAIHNFSQEVWRRESKHAHDIANSYSRESWLSKVKSLGNTESVFLVSDYIARIGGIESMLFNIKYMLEDDGSQVYMYGWKVKKGRRLGLRRKLGLLSTSYNWSNYIKLSIGINQHNPTLIWLHSVNRYLGWFPMTALQKSPNRQIWCSVHDLGMFHPFGAEAENISDIPDFTLTGFTQLTRNPVKKFFIMLKYFSLWLLQKQLMQKVDKRIVPSQFMVEVLHTRRGIPEKNILILPHFIS